MSNDDGHDERTGEHDDALDGAALGPAVLRAAREYNRPSDVVPREPMWDAIRARRGASAEVPAQPVLRVERGEAAGAAAAFQPALRAERGEAAGVPAAARGIASAPRRWPRWSYAAAAVLVLAAGIGIGRSLQWSQPGSRGSLVTVADNGALDTTDAAAFTMAATDHFGQVETLLTWVNATPEARRDAQVAAWSRDLLASTRLLLDSPAGKDARRRQLLRDLELVLVQMVQLAPEAAAEDRTAVDDLLRRTTLLLTRLRTSVPAGMAPAHD